MAAHDRESFTGNSRFVNRSLWVHKVAIHRQKFAGPDVLGDMDQEVADQGFVIRFERTNKNPPIIPENDVSLPLRWIWGTLVVNSNTSLGVHFTLQTAITNRRWAIKRGSLRQKRRRHGYYSGAFRKLKVRDLPRGRFGH